MVVGPDRSRGAGRDEQRPEPGRFATGLEGMLRFRRPFIVLIHAALTALSLWLAFVLRFDLVLPPVVRRQFFLALPILLVIRLTVFYFFDLFEGLWRYVSMKDLASILKAVSVSSVAFVVVAVLTIGSPFPRSVFILEWLLASALVGGIRFLIRAVREGSPALREGQVRRALVIGAGDAADQLIRSVHSSLTLNYDLVGLVDDDPRKKKTQIRGVEVVGSIVEIPQLVASLQVDEIVVAAPSASLEEKRRIMQSSRLAGVPVRSVPTLRELVDGQARIGQLEEVDPEHLLSREAVSVDLNAIRREVGGRTILVTGAGGSIGSELCRQLAPFDPQRLVLLDRAESNLYYTQMEFAQRHPDLEVIPIVGDILDERKVSEVLSAYLPEIIYHAAAYKHVPLMEAHPLEAIGNNVFGTEVLAEQAIRFGVKKFVFISTDKAVRPVGIMGMTKRVAEGLLLSLSSRSTTFSCVRFGNVLGSAGSVMPVFQWQLAASSPVTITDPEATRYFMLLSEAAQLVLQAGSMSIAGGEVFFLDMGTPVRIGQLAKDLIHLSGLKPGRDVAVETIGLRPGERMNEELITDSEELLPSMHEKVFMLWKPDFEPNQFRAQLEILRMHVQGRDRAAAVETLKEMALHS
jgi:FlaA1/EpsC-like NDP-sugar epimerase